MCIRDSVTSEVRGLKERVERGEKNLENRIDRAIEKKLRGDMSNLPAGHHPRALNFAVAPPQRVKPSSEDRYWTARRSLRLWPVPGPDLEAGVRDFFRTRLKFDQARVDSFGSLRVRRVETRGKSNQKEVAVTFLDVDTRDAVRSEASNLAGQSEAGIRLEIPDYLRPSLRSLESVSYHMKKAHPGMKRNVRFDDEALDLVLDVKLGENHPWKRIRPSQAQAV